MLDYKVILVDVIYQVMRQVSIGLYKGIVGYCDELLVSVDFLGCIEFVIYDEM